MISGWLKSLIDPLLRLRRRRQAMLARQRCLELAALLHQIELGPIGMDGATSRTQLDDLRRRCAALDRRGKELRRHRLRLEWDAQVARAYAESQSEPV